QLVRGIINVEQKALFVSGAGQRRCITAMCWVRSIEWDELWAERCAAAGDDRGSSGIVRVRDVVLMNVPGLKGDVPVVVEFVIIGAANPLQVVVAPLAAIQCVQNDVDVILAVIARPAHAESAGWHRTGVLEECRTWIQRISWQEVRETCSYVPGHR